MKRFNIPKRPKYQFISDLRGQNHSLFGKSWESLLGKKDSDKRKKESAKRFRELTIRRLKNKEFPFFDTKIEIIMAKALLNVGISFVKQFNMDNRFVCDFAIPHLKIVIECDGDYWHANPQIYKNKQLTFRQEKNIRRDRCKDQYIKGQGWKIIRFYESEILNSLEKCIRDVKEAISSEELKKIKSPIEDLMK
jgi:DNA mismatch endonuclease Vsr